MGFTTQWSVRTIISNAHFSHFGHWQNFAWRLKLTEPYRAYRYDVLHVDDLGIFGHHLFKNGILKIVEEMGKLHELDDA
jgi:hypothetical protein